MIRFEPLIPLSPRLLRLSNTRLPDRLSLIPPSICVADGEIQSPLTA